MNLNAWTKNLFFIGLAVIGFATLTVFLMATDRVAAPESFAPSSKAQFAILNVAKTVDASFKQEWNQKDLGMQAAGRADDLTIARRLSLGLTGTVPSLQEIREFESQEPQDRIHWWVSHLLEDRRTSNHLAERFTRAFVGVDDGPFILYRRRRFVKWLGDQIHDNVRYDQIVRQLLTGEGLWTDSPSVNFYTVTIGDTEQPDPVRLAGRTSRALLGMRIDCLQCHDDFLGTINLGSADDPTGGMQTDFHSLAAFFAQTNVSLLGIKDGGDKEYQYQLLEADEESVISPKVPFNQELVDDNISSLQKQLAEWVVHPENRPFARATVNRVWAIMCGKPLVEPVDDIPLEGPFPQAMEVLADDLVNNNFDLQRLIRTIAETEAFQRDSRADFEITDQHVENWKVFPLIRLRPDQVAGAAIQSTSFTTIDATAHIITRLTQFGQQNDFVERYGDAGEDEFAARGETVTQRLLMLNGEMIDDRLTTPLNSPVRVSVLSPNTEQAIETVYLATLTRRPTAPELTHFKSQLDQLQGTERTKKILDIYWTLVNSIEFVWNH